MSRPERRSQLRSTTARTTPPARLGVLALATLLGLIAVLGGAPAPEARATTSGHPQLRFEAGPAGILDVDDRRRYRDTLELSDGVLINELDLEDYVAGVAEMPSRWPLEALKAQAVAARTYAWYVLRTGVYDGYDICATVACQVYRGVEVELDEGTPTRWRAAVDATAGEVLVDEAGAPILARYFSTSGGRTFANEEAFPSEGPRPYLVSIDDPADAVSPYHRWTVRFTREELDAVLGRGDTLGAAVPVAAIERLGAVDDPNAVLRVTGRDGTAVEVSARAFADFVSRIAPDQFPDRFPPMRADGLRPLPSTVPSSRFAVVLDDEAAVLEGQGWGHGVGMGQYGARGRADDGDDYRAILAAYYAGLAPTTSSALPQRIRVGLDLGDQVHIRGDVAVRILAGEEVVVERALGTWTATWGDNGWQLTPPDGHDQDLEVTPTVQLGALSTDALVVVEAEVSTPALLHLDVRDPAGVPIRRHTLGAVEAGRHAVSWPLDDDDGQPVPAGRYLVAVVGEDAAGQREGTPVEVEVGPPGRGGRPAPDDATAAEPTMPGLRSTLPLLVVVTLAGLGLLALLGVLAVARGRPRR